MCTHVYVGVHVSVCTPYMRMFVESYYMSDGIVTSHFLSLTFGTQWSPKGIGLSFTPGFDTCRPCPDTEPEVRRSVMGLSGFLVDWGLVGGWPWAPEPETLRP